MATGWPSDTDLEAWFNLAVQMDQNQAADEAFQASLQIAPTTHPSMSVFSRPASATSPAKFAHSHPSLGNPVPMDIDAAWKAKAIPNVCHRCGATGHWVKDCPHKFNVQYMDMDKLETVLE